MGLTKNIQNNFASLKNIQYLPRWIIFAIDLLIVIFSVTFGYFILKGMGINATPSGNIFTVFGIFVFIHLFLFLYFKPYTGIIRHTTVMDADKLFFIESFAFTGLYLINAGFDYFTGQRLFLNTVLFICIFVTYMMLLVFRLMVKMGFDFFTEYSEKTYQTSAVIYGSGDR